MLKTLKSKHPLNASITSSLNLVQPFERFTASGCKDSSKTLKNYNKHFTFKRVLPASKKLLHKNYFHATHISLRTSYLKADFNNKRFNNDKKNWIASNSKN